MDTGQNGLRCDAIRTSSALVSRSGRQVPLKAVCTCLKTPQIGVGIKNKEIKIPKIDMDFFSGDGD